jgi:hypothetical protein
MKAESDRLKRSPSGALYEIDETRNTNRAVSEILLAQIEVIEAAIRAFQAQQNQRAGEERRRFWLLLAILITVVFFAGLTALIWREMVSIGKQTERLIEIAATQNKSTEKLATAASIQADAAIDQVNHLRASVEAANATAKTAREALALGRTSLIQDRRPYVLSATIEEPTLKIGEAIKWNFTYTNFGKSPAIDVISKSRILWGKDALGTVAPDFFKRMRPLAGEKHGTLIPQGQNYSLTAQSDRILNRSMLEEVTKSDGALVLLVRLEYLDSSGNEYFTNVCTHRLKTGALADCGRYNSFK